MPIERAQVQGCYSNITIRHTLMKMAILHYKRPRVGNNLQPTAQYLTKGKLIIVWKNFFFDFMPDFKNLGHFMERNHIFDKNLKKYGHF